MVKSRHGKSRYPSTPTQIIKIAIPCSECVSCIRFEDNSCSGVEKLSNDITPYCIRDWNLHNKDINTMTRFKKVK